MKILLFVILALFSSACPAGARVACDDAKLIWTILSVHESDTEQEANTRAGQMLNVAISIYGGNSAFVDERTVHSLEELLGSPFPYVQVYAAEALGVLGRRATHALPRLKATLRSYAEPKPKKGEILFISLDGRTEIKAAISEIETGAGGVRHN